MIDIPNEVKQAFHSDYSIKYLYVDFPMNENMEAINDEKIISDSFELTESICSESQLRFGACESSVVSFEVINDGRDTMSGELMDIYMFFESVPEYTFKIGRYFILKDEMSSDHQTRSIEAYDLLYLARYQDVTEWYYGLEWPMTAKQFRDSFFSYLGITCEDVNLVNDLINLPGPTLSDETIDAGTIMEMICSFNGVFGHIDRNNIFKFISLSDPNGISSLYPGPTTFPGPTTYPGSTLANGIILDPSICREDIEWQTYICQRIQALELRTSSETIAYDYIPSETIDNYYVVTNALFDNLDSTSLLSIARALYEKMQSIEYTPCTVRALGDLSLEVGDAFIFTADDGTNNNKKKSFILSRTITGIQDLFDEYYAEGPSVYEWNEPNTNAALQSQINEQSVAISDINDRVSELEATGASIKILSVTGTPTNPQTGVLYLIQGTVVIS